MKVGIIILLRNSENQIDKDFLIKYSNKVKSIELCFVNNESKDCTYGLLKEIKEECNNVSIVNIKKIKPDNMAVRAGARFMFNQFKLDHLGYINIIGLRKNDFHEILKTIKISRAEIVNLNIEKIQKNKIKFTLFQKLFSVKDYIDKLELNKQLIKSHL